MTKQGKQVKKVKNLLKKTEIIEVDKEDPSLIFNFPDPSDMRDLLLLFL